MATTWKKRQLKEKAQRPENVGGPKREKITVTVWFNVHAGRKRSHILPPFY